jgi:3-hydroxymyristoyl/3-hydroxydecanoyl-(acyl carrier protein) dehydratase
VKTAVLVTFCSGLLYPSISPAAQHNYRTMQFAISADHPCLPGHFPGRPLVPGVVLLERVIEAAQAAHGPLGALRLPQVKFLQPLLPEQVAEVELETLGATRWRFRVRRSGEVLASGEIVAESFSASSPATDAHA